METKEVELPIIRRDEAECERCLAELTGELGKVKGVHDLQVEGERGILRVAYDPNLLSGVRLEQQVRDAGLAITRRIQHETLSLGGLHCADCAATIERALQRLPGVLFSSVNFASGKARVEYDTARTPREEVIRQINGVGYTVLETSPGDQAEGRFWRDRQAFTTILSGILLILAFAASLLDQPWFIVNGLYATSAISGGFSVARSGLAAVRATRTLDINILMTIAAIGAAAIGEWAEAATVVFLFSLGEVLEGFSMDRTRRAIRGLMGLAPDRALVLRDGRPVQVAVSEVAIGETVVVRPGEKIPVDGTVARGLSTVNQAPITGESSPVIKEPGSPVFSGTINERGSLEIAVTRHAADTTLQRIIRMVEEAHGQKAASQRFVDRFARYYTPAVVGVAALVAALPPLLFGAPFTLWLYRALVLLVIACPCALVISTPVSIVSALTRAARSGVLIKGGVYLEAAGRVRAVAFDKTGTLTAGRPEVTDVIALDTLAPDAVLGLAAALEIRSEHHFGTAIVQYALERGIAAAPAERFETHPGRGVSGLVQGKFIHLGSPGWIGEHGVPLDGARPRVEALEAEGKTVILVAAERVLGAIAIADRPREEAGRVVETLRRLGLERTIMLTGDNGRTARAVAEEVGVDEYHAELLPEEKVEAIRNLQARYRNVAMVGDGVNDAPALAAASLGIAMGVAGTDVALETADVALMGDDLNRVPWLITLSRRALRVIQQNIGASLLIKAVFLLLAIPGWTTLWLAVGADMGVSLLVIANGMRLLGGRE